MNRDQVSAMLQHFRDIGSIRDISFPPSVDTWIAGWEEMASHKWIGAIAPRSVFLLHGDKDDVVPVEQAYELYRLAQEPKKLRIITGAGHRLRIEEEAVATISAWLKQPA